MADALGLQTRTVLALTVHPPTIAATRLRVVAYREHLSRRGIDLRLWTLFSADDLPTWYGDSQLGRLWTLLRAMARLLRLPMQLRRAHAVIIHREVLPFGSGLVERLVARRGLPLIWDVDDAVWQPFESPTAGWVARLLRGSGGKYRWLRAHATEIWAGSQVLADWCREAGRPTVLVPTVVEVPEERPPAYESRLVGWIGSHSTSPFIEQLLPAVAAVEPPCRLVVVGSTIQEDAGQDIEVHSWSQDVEDRALDRMRVGLYPVDVAHPLAEGKCGLKAILYMSRGIPPVITPTTPNASIVRDGMEGLYATTPAEWTQAVQTLLDDADLWEKLSAAAYERARDHFSLQVWGDRVADRVEAILGSAR